MKIIKQPRFALIEKQKWRTFSCIETGKIIVSVDGEEFELNFEEDWETDLTSTPRLLLWILPQLGAHTPASACHDLALSMVKKGLIDRKTARKIGYSVLDSLSNEVGFVEKAAWKFGVWFNDTFLK